LPIEGARPGVYARAPRGSRIRSDRSASRIRSISVCPSRSASSPRPAWNGPRWRRSPFRRGRERVYQGRRSCSAFGRGHADRSGSARDRGGPKALSELWRVALPGGVLAMDRSAAGTSCSGSARRRLPPARGREAGESRASSWRSGPPTSSGAAQLLAQDPAREAGGRERLAQHEVPAGERSIASTPREGATRQSSESTFGLLDPRADSGSVPRARRPESRTRPPSPGILRSAPPSERETVSTGDHSTRAAGSKREREDRRDTPNPRGERSDRIDSPEDPGRTRRGARPRSQGASGRVRSEELRFTHSRATRRGTPRTGPQFVRSGSRPRSLSARGAGRPFALERDDGRFAGHPRHEPQPPPVQAIEARSPPEEEISARFEAFLRGVPRPLVVSEETLEPGLLHRDRAWIVSGLPLPRARAPIARVLPALRDAARREASSTRAW